MGGNNSTTRRVTITEENIPSMAITLDVAQRLQGITPPPPPPPTQRPADTTPRDEHQAQEPVINAKYMEEAVRKVEEHYQHKMQAMKEKSEELTRTRLEHLQEAIAEAEAKFTSQSKEPVCLQQQIDVFECYRNNPKNSLHCAKEAKEFSACVQETQRKVFGTADLYAAS